MAKKDEKIFVIAIIAIVIIALYLIPLENTYLGLFFEQISEPNWNDIEDRDIVKNTIPVILNETMNDKCKVSAPTFNLIIDHQYFKRGAELANALNYDRESGTLVLPCEILPDKTSRLHVWYILEESEKHSKKYKYFVTPWNETLAE